MRKRLVAAFLVVLFLGNASAAEKNESPHPAQSIDELRQQLENILRETHTPAVSVAIVRKDRQEWVTALGVADVASGRSATADTLFRIGSTSKAFTSLAILKLVDEGKLSLQDRVRKLAPDVWFANQWEDTDPVRVVNLLEHTTGWDDMHLREYAKDAKGMDLHIALDFGRSSRISRWRPGTRMAYCNSGPAVAAYIVEKITGQRFEDYVQQNFFLPMGMKSATYFLTPTASMVTLYHPDGKTPYPYWHILYRPAGSINASARDMAAYLQFYLHRGSVDGVSLMPSGDLDRMESPVSTWAARDGLKSGYGLSNYWSIQDGFVYHGHNGGVNGGLTELAYLPDEDVAYFFSINSGNGAAFVKMSKCIRNYITLRLQKPPVPPAASLPSDAASYAGWYEPDAPRQQKMYFLERLGGLNHVAFPGGTMTISNLSGAQKFVPVTGRFFRYVPKSGPPEPVATAALLSPNSDGVFIQAGTTLKRLPGWLACLQIALTSAVLIAMFSILLYAPFWMIGGLKASRRRPAERLLRWYPLIAVSCALGVVLLFVGSGGDPIDRLGNPSFWSIGICVCTLGFAGSVLMSVWAVIVTASSPIVRQSVWWFSAMVSGALLVAAGYLAYWGVIGIRTWA